MAKGPIVIVGGGRAAASMIDSYREAGGDAPITLVSEEEHPPYNRPPLSKGILRGEMAPDEALVHTTEEYDELAVELRLGTVAESIDTRAHMLSLVGGETIPYGTLVIASGTRPRKLPVAGADLPAVHTFRTLADAIAIGDAAPDARKAIVVGGSFIGSEVAASLRVLGLEVTIIELGERLVPALGSEELSEQVAELYRSHGVELLLGEKLEEFQANGRLLTGVRTASGRLIEAFVAVVGVGVEPCTHFLETSEVGLDDGVVVDDHFRTSAADIFAIGDVAKFDDVVSGRKRRIEHWSNADAHGKHLGRNLAGGRKGYEHVPAFFTKLFDVPLQLLGDTDDVEEVVLRGSIQEKSLIGFYLREERLTAAVVVGQTTDMVDELKALVHDRPLLRDRGNLVTKTVRPAALFQG